eukprot:TRINITY_DN24564_c0_g1_i1.p1 TRINITY_DN24564_c0_g1~~TRINITY_DN24564_c0_g1_i1.p1  ORF type:complete len:219 (-),score=45.05 TRINITY_DN24564_c0_g1_i1:142-798(-)
MYLLLRYGYRKLFQKKQDRNVCILGLDGAGKTSLLNDIRRKFGLRFQDPTEITPTVYGQNASKVDYEHFSLQVWDLGGQKKNRDVWNLYYDDTDLLIWVINAADKERVTSSLYALAAVLQDERMRYVPVCVVAGKQDLPGAASKADIERMIADSQCIGDEHSFCVLEMCLGGPFEKHSELEPMFAWISETFADKQSSADQRSSWRKTASTRLAALAVS